MLNMLYDIILSEPSTLFCVIHDYVTVTVTDMWLCDSDVMLTLTLSLQNKNERKENNKWEKKNKIVRVYCLEFWQ